MWLGALSIALPGNGKWNGKVISDYLSTKKGGDLRSLKELKEASTKKAHRGFLFPTSVLVALLHPYLPAVQLRSIEYQCFHRF